MRHGQDTKARIERAALELFVEQGVAETSIREIAGAAGVSLGAMYNHFQSKEELAWSLFSVGFSELATELRHRAREHPTIDAKLSAMVRYVFESFDKDWIMISFLFLARHQHLRQVTHRIGNPYIVFRTVIAEAIRSGELPKQDPELAAALVTGAVIQVIDVKILGRITGDLSRLSERVAGSCLRLLKA